MLSREDSGHFTERLLHNQESLVAFSVFSVIALLKDKQNLSSKARLPVAFLLVIVPLVSLFLVRSLIPSSSQSNYVAVIVNQILRFEDPRFLLIMMQATFSGLGLLPILMLLNFQESYTFLSENIEWLLFGLISIFLLFGGGDKSRLYLYFLPLAVFISLKVMDDLRLKMHVLMYSFWTVIILFAHSFIGGYLSPIRSFDIYLRRMVPEHAEGNFLPYLVMNLAISLLIVLLTMNLSRTRFEQTDLKKLD